jgi:hypothetical protein
MQRLADPKEYDPWETYARTSAADLRKVQTSFRVHPDMQAILEHAELKDHTRHWFYEIERLRVALGISRYSVRQAIAANERLGGSVKNNVLAPELGVCNAVSVRYAYHALRMVQHWSQVYGKNKGPRDVIEIGGGYGGFAVVLLSLLHVSKWCAPPATYTLMDLPGVSELQHVYTTLALPAECSKATRMVFVPYGRAAAPVADECYLFSAYSYSELPVTVQQHYDDNVLQSAAHGFFVWNTVPSFHSNTFAVTCLQEQIIKQPGHELVFLTRL